MDVSPEPTPHWGESLPRWGALWNIHIYTIGAIFIVISFFNAVSLLMHVFDRNTASRRIFKCYCTINLLLFFFNATRGLSLVINPYNSNVHHLKLSQGTWFMFWGMTVPCFTASFMLMNMALLDATKMQLYSKKVQNMKLIGGIVIFNFVLVIGVDLTATLRPSLYWILYVCQVFFMLFGVAVAGAMIFTGCQVLRKVRESERQLRSFNNLVVVNKAAATCRDVTDTEQGKDSTVAVAVTTVASKSSDDAGRKDEGTWKSKKFQRSTKRFTMISTVISVAAILYSLVQIYSFVAVYSVENPNKPIPPWHWMAYQTIARLLEVSMSLCVSYIVRSKKEILQGNLRWLRKRTSP